MNLPARVAQVIFFLALFVLNAFSQSIGSFERIGNMTTSRSGHAATLLRDGRVLLTGGFVREAVRIDGNFYGYGLVSAELYDPSNGTFSPTGSMHIPRWMGTSTLLADGRVLIVGGCYCPEAEIFDPSSGTFTPTGKMVSNPKFLSGAALLRDGRVLVVGDASVELYDPKSGTFTRTDGKGIFGPAILLQDGTVFAGDDTAALRFDPVTDSFTMLRAGSAFTSYNADPATALANGQVLFAGGRSDPYGFDSLSKAALFDPASSQFFRVRDLGLARTFHTATLLRDGRVLIAGGWSGEADTNGVELYDSATKTFSSIGAMMSERSAHTATMLRDGRVLITGGFVAGEPSVSAELFIPDYTLGSVPALSMDSSEYCVGEPWKMRVEGAPAFAGVTLMGAWDSSPWSIPDWRTTGSDGTFVADGTFDGSAVGDHTLWVLAASKASKAVSITVSPCRVNLMVDSLFQSGASWVVRVAGSIPDAVVTLEGTSNGVNWKILDWGRTKSDGTFVVTGAFPLGVEGDHQLRVRIGTEQSNVVRFTVHK